MNAAIVNPNGRYNRVTEACSQTNWSRNTLMRVAEEANAVIRVGRTVRIDMQALYEYIDKNYK
nr:DUF6462 family protein [uncultured Blautia sp.]